MRVANNNAISTTLIHWGCILSPFMLKFTKILQKIFCTHIFFPDKFIKSRAMNEREMSSDISGGIFLPHGVNSTSDWLPRYKHHVLAPVLWPIISRNSHYGRDSDWWDSQILSNIINNTLKIAYAKWKCKPVQKDFDMNNLSIFFWIWRVTSFASYYLNLAIKDLISDASYLRHAI